MDFIIRENPIFLQRNGEKEKGGDRRETVIRLLIYDFQAGKKFCLAAMGAGDDNTNPADR